MHLGLEEKKLTNIHTATCPELLLAAIAKQLNSHKQNASCKNAKHLHIHIHMHISWIHTCVAKS